MANKRISYGTGSWSTIERKGITYYRFRKTYGNERKEFTGRTKKEVYDKIKAYEENPVLKTQQHWLKTTFSDFAYACACKFAEIKRLPKAEPTDYQKHTLNRLKETKLGKTQLGCITSSTLTAYLMELNEKEYARRTINTDYGFVKRCLAYAVSKKILNENPADEVSYLREEEANKKAKVVPALQITDIEKLLKESTRVNTEDHIINGQPGTKVYGVNADVICFLFYTGLRINECLALSWQDVFTNDEGHSFIQVKHSLKEVRDENGKIVRQRGKTKTQGSIRNVSLNQEALKIIETQKQRNSNKDTEDFIFQTDEGTPIARRNVNRTLKTMMKRAKCSQIVSVHSLRHSFGSFLISNRADLYAVSKLLGHASIKITEQIYAELLQDTNVATTAILDKLKRDA